MEVFEAIRSRRSIRKFKADAIPDSYITELIDAARLAPSGTNLQPTRYIVIKSEAAREKLKECTPLAFVPAAPAVIACLVDNTVMGSTGERMRELNEAKAFVGTPLESGNEAAAKREEQAGNIDLAAMKAYLNLNAAIAIEHITLRAVELGLGTCWVMMFDKEKVKTLLQIEDRYDIAALIPVGYPDQAPAQRPRLDMSQVLLKEI